MLTAAGRRVRAAIAVVVLVLAAAGTLWGQDDHFPFAPFRMFATRTSPQGEVSVVQLRGQLAGSEPEVTLSMGSFGLRRAEVEGQLDRLTRPGRLGALVQAREAIRGDLPRLAALRLVQVRYVLRDGRQVGQREVTLAQWRR